MARVLRFIWCVVLIQFALAEVDNFFPFGAGNGDTVIPAGDDGFASATLQHPFKYFNNSYTQAYVSINGIISFNQPIFFLPRCTSGSTPAIAPFWADAYTLQSGSVSFRESTNFVDMLKAKLEIVATFPQYLLTLNLDSVFIATWNNVSFYGSQNCPSSSGITNTFQAILARDGNKSFVIFDYNDMDWSAGLGANCQGTGGPQSAQVGFDTGHDVFYGLPPSCTSNVVNIENTSNVNQPGKWIFQVDELYQNTNCGLVCTLLGTVTRLG